MVQDALANFIEILPMFPQRKVVSKLEELVQLLRELLTIASINGEIEKEEDFNKLLVCNNSCWAIGELS